MRARALSTRANKTFFFWPNTRSGTYARARAFATLRFANVAVGSIVYRRFIKATFNCKQQKKRTALAVALWLRARAPPRTLFVGQNESKKAAYSRERKNECKQGKKKYSSVQRDTFSIALRVSERTRASSSPAARRRHAAAARRRRRSRCQRRRRHHRHRHRRPADACCCSCFARKGKQSVRKEDRTKKKHQGCAPAVTIKDEKTSVNLANKRRAAADWRHWQYDAHTHSFLLVATTVDWSRRFEQKARAHTFFHPLISLVYSLAPPNGLCAGCRV